MAKKEKFSLAEQLAVKKAIQDEFKLEEKRIAQAWLDSVDLEPNENNPDHWDFLLYNSNENYYVNLKFFPRITIEPAHTTQYNIGILNYKKDMPLETVIWYMHNVLD